MNWILICTLLPSLPSFPLLPVADPYGRLINPSTRPIQHFSPGNQDSTFLHLPIFSPPSPRHHHRQTSSTEPRPLSSSSPPSAVALPSYPDRNSNSSPLVIHWPLRSPRLPRPVFTTLLCWALPRFSASRPLHRIHVTLLTHADASCSQSIERVYHRSNCPHLSHPFMLCQLNQHSSTST